MTLVGLGLCAATILQACGGGAPGRDPLGEAESEFNAGNYASAQQLCDSLLLGESLTALSVDQLCRLTLLFMRLGDSAGDIDANTAFAARTLKAAVDRNADSTLIFLNSIPLEDKARLAILTAINEARYAPAVSDSTDTDTLEIYE